MGFFVWFGFYFCWILPATRRAGLHHVEEAAETFCKDVLRTIIETEENRRGKKSNTEALV